MSYYAITIFTEWDLPPTTVALIYQVSSQCIVADGNEKVTCFATQATITMGYFFSPFVMSGLNTRPLFIATLLISAVAQVYFVFAFCICICICIGISIGICICDIPTEHLSSIHHCTPHQRCSSGNCN